jgi:hypothetical protein
MPRKVPLLIAALCLPIALRAQGLTTYLPAKPAAMAAKLLSSIDSSMVSIEAKRKAAVAARSKAEAEEVEAYALIAAARSSGGPWARPDGRARSEGAPAAFVVARGRAQAASLALARGEGGGDGASIEALAAIFLASRSSEKASLGLEKYLESAPAAKQLARLFPEASEIVGLLRKAGSAGAREAAAALARRDAGGIASALVAAKARILVLSPDAASPLARLESATSAYGAWTAASSVAAYPGSLRSISEEDRLILSAGIKALESLGAERCSTLLAAMTALSSRDSAASEAARRLAAVWNSLSAARRRELAYLCGVGESALSRFASAATTPAPARKAEAKPVVANDILSSVAALNGLEISIADEESSAVGVRGAEPALLFFERPELAALARSERRYAELDGEAWRRLDALLAQAAEGAQSRLEAQDSVARAAALALGAKAELLVVGSVDLGPSPPGPDGAGEPGRRIAFFATATDATGASVSFPIGAELAGTEYSIAFAKAARLGPSKGDLALAFSRYGQSLVSAYDPEGSKDYLAIEAFPQVGAARSEARPAPRFLGATDLELALLGGWQP